MMMLGEKVTAEQALSYGMIYRVVEPDKLIEESRAFAAQLEAEADLQGTAGRSDDFEEGVAAFLGKRPPRFEGR